MLRRRGARRFVHALADEIGELRRVLDFDRALIRGILADVIRRRRREDGQIFAQVLALILGGDVDAPDFRWRTALAGWFVFAGRDPEIFFVDGHLAWHIIEADQFRARRFVNRDRAHAPIAL